MGRLEIRIYKRTKQFITKDLDWPRALFGNSNPQIKYHSFKT